MICPACPIGAVINEPMPVSLALERSHRGSTATSCAFSASPSARQPLIGFPWTGSRLPRGRMPKPTLAALAVFLERGYIGASISEIARRAGLGTPAFYRRWPTKAALAIDVTAHWSAEEPIPDTGSIRDDLLEFLRFRIRMFGTPFFHRVLLPVVLEAAAKPGLSEAIGARFLDYSRPMDARIRAAIASGELRAGTDPHMLI